MGRGADAGRRVVERSGFGPCGGDELRDGLRSVQGRGDEHVRYAAERRDRGEVPRRIVGQARMEPWRDGERRGGGEDRVAVGGGPRDHGDRDRSAGSAAVFDHDRLPELDRELIEHDPGHDVDGASRARRDERADRPRRPCLRRGEAGSRGQRGGARCQAQELTTPQAHRLLPRRHRAAQPRAGGRQSDGVEAIPAATSLLMVMPHVTSAGLQAAFGLPRRGRNLHARICNICAGTGRHAMSRRVARARFVAHIRGPDGDRHANRSARRPDVVSVGPHPATLRTSS